MYIPKSENLLERTKKKMLIFKIYIDAAFKMSHIFAKVCIQPSL